MFKCKLRDSTDDKLYAAKMYRPDNRFLLDPELKALKQLDHPSAVKVFDWYGVNFESDGTVNVDESQ